MMCARRVKTMLYVDSVYLSSVSIDVFLTSEQLNVYVKNVEKHTQVPWAGTLLFACVYFAAVVVKEINTRKPYTCKRFFNILACTLEYDIHVPVF